MHRLNFYYRNNLNNCEMTEIVDGCENSSTEIDLKADQIKKNDFILNF